MLLWLGHGCRDGSAPIISIAKARVVSYAGGAMIGAGGRKAVVAAATASALAAIVVVRECWVRWLDGE